MQSIFKNLSKNPFKDGEESAGSAIECFGFAGADCEILIVDKDEYLVKIV